MIAYAEVRAHPQVDHDDFFGTNPEPVHNLSLSELGIGNNVIGFVGCHFEHRPRIDERGKRSAKCPIRDVSEIVDCHQQLSTIEAWDVVMRTMQQVRSLHHSRNLPLLSQAVNRSIRTNPREAGGAKFAHGLLPRTGQTKREIALRPRVVLEQILKVSPDSRVSQHSGIDRNYPLHFPFLKGSLNRFKVAPSVSLISRPGLAGEGSGIQAVVPFKSDN